MPPAIPVENDAESAAGDEVKDTKADPSDTNMADENQEEDDEEEDEQTGAKEILKEYWHAAGGRPDPDAPKQTKKRGRQSNASTKATGNSAKKPRTSKGGRKSNGALEQDVDHGGLIGFTEVGEDDWKPPTAKEGSWDALVQSVDTVIREAADGELWGYLIWNEKNDDGRLYRSRAKLPIIYKACPQRLTPIASQMLQFYEKHLVFSTDTTETAGEDKEAA
ncbi:uncharacterized protein KY384_002593 [Bacidia gigantensis]|uniref:uncharacterized protein n=1 Tax=Bacidia gigantensis TaxID=2732470 RepID=UPI001D04C410|nr:uncharacterized protein KY384_002593 [Bacidia gigantensis]KAG8532716.1 hypothetical protein KY384_002593 [Bacidia gigantensis]